jgi:hypothetical protein
MAPKRGIVPSRGQDAANWEPVIGRCTTFRTHRAWLCATYLDTDLDPLCTHIHIAMSQRSTHKGQEPDGLPLDWVSASPPPRPALHCTALHHITSDGLSLPTYLGRWLRGSSGGHYLPSSIPPLPSCRAKSVLQESTAFQNPRDSVERRSGQSGLRPSRHDQ